MLKYVLYAVLLLIVAGVVAGGVHLWRVAKRNKAEMSRYAESPREPLPDLGKVLVFIIRFPAIPGTLRPHSKTGCRRRA